MNAGDAAAGDPSAPDAARASLARAVTLEARIRAIESFQRSHWHRVDLIDRDRLVPVCVLVSMTTAVKLVRASPDGAGFVLFTVQGNDLIAASVGAVIEGKAAAAFAARMTTQTAVAMPRDVALPSMHPFAPSHRRRTRQRSPRRAGA